MDRKEVKWLSEIWSVVSSLSLKSRTIFVFAVLIVVGGYFFFDRFLDYKEAIAGVSATQNKRVIEKDTSYKELGLSYADYIELYKDSRNNSRGAK